MRIPRKYIKAKVDTGKNMKRHLNSAGASRRGETLKKKSFQQSSESQHQPGNKSTDKEACGEKSLGMEYNK